MPSSSFIGPVFVSSTSLDLEPERRAVEGALNRLHETKFIGMEYFGSRTIREASLNQVDRSAAYIGILAGRYASGITEAEYERGLDFIYFKDQAAITRKCGEVDDEKSARLIVLKEIRALHIDLLRKA